MTHTALLFACVLQAVEGGGVQDPRCNTPEVWEIATAINQETTEHNVERYKGVVASVMWHESRFKKYARGKKGEIGRMQLLRGGAIPKGDKRSFHTLAQTGINTHLGVKYLAPSLLRCKNATGGLTIYNNGHGCFATKYSTGVLSDLRMGRRWASQLWYAPIESVRPEVDLKTEMTLHER